MKKLIIALATSAAISISAITFIPSFTNETLECQHGRCIKIKSNGYQCKNCAQEYSAYCWSHNN